MNPPDLRRLRYFVAVAEELHFGRAARRLNVSQPPLSVQIRTLEREIGAPLLTRTQRRVELTEAGRVLLDEALRLLDQAEAAVVHARRAAEGAVGRLAIGFVSTVDYSILPPLVRRFRQKHPGIALKLLELTGNRQQALLQSGELDLGLSILRSPDAVALRCARSQRSPSSSFRVSWHLACTTLRSPPARGRASRRTWPRRRSRCRPSSAWSPRAWVSPSCRSACRSCSAPTCATLRSMRAGSRSRPWRCGIPRTARRRLRRSSPSCRRRLPPRACRLLAV